MTERNEVTDVPKVDIKIPPIGTATQALPQWLRPIFVVSQKDDAYDALQKRLGAWKDYCFRWKSPDVKSIKEDWNVWVFKEKVRQYCNLTPDEIAYAETHIQIWKDCVRRKENMFVVDDTCLLEPSTLTVLEEAKTRLENIQFDLLYITHTNRHKPKQYVTSFIDSPNIVIPQNAQGMSAYIITPKGASFLLDGVYPIDLPIDVYVHRRTDREMIRCYAIYPAPF